VGSSSQSDGASGLESGLGSGLESGLESGRVSSLESGPGSGNVSNLRSGQRSGLESGLESGPLVLIYFKLMADNQISDEVYKGSWDHIKGIAKSVIDEND